ncbi:5-oxoprolinase (ATP-hydrolyzing) [Alkalilimnicola ehrlichii MLHE-1]|uniref:5-oxoprolinase (ATP-hydrolyzing) n=1 Tax=Alkalilimnicola ehrlichii (strain ATCC BAA-1101 / DSM 17681 / MLHE-1) TaxID=187272 RepID=Q0A5A3_ALKEH|nr:5-oxoprolinase (ATP-hydrolyzing) [Alkalilimnicola ehrlichii MLHE-1]
MQLLGVDTGGTFTDFVCSDGERLRIHKVLSTPERPEAAILQGVRELGLADEPLRLMHGSTVATNAVLEGQGARVMYVTGRGLGDVLTLGRQHRERLYALELAPAEPPVPPELCWETGGRLGPDGALVDPLSDEDLAAFDQALAERRPEAVAINLPFSFVDGGPEDTLAARVPEGVFVARSHKVLAEYGEYERGIATWLNARVGPVMSGYLNRLTQALPKASVSVMQSSGERVAADQAARMAVNLLLSGPAGGLMAGRYLGELAGEPRLLSFDMGGTSTDVAVIDGEPALTSEGHIGGWPVAVPMVDMHTIGAGGGSLASVDAGGLLQVGPRSAGADPGPACYGRGGAGATVTDAHLVLGRLRPDAFLGGDMTLEPAAARQALTRLGEGLALSPEQAAEGVLRLANEHMARALRVISVERGLDPRDFTLLSFGGAGGLHVCALAEALDMSRALVPVHAGVLSALGMLAAPRGRQLSRTLTGPLSALGAERVEQVLAALADSGRRALSAEGVAVAEQRTHPSLDLRYQGQAYTLNVAWSGVAATLEAFHRLHEQRYGHRLEEPVELVNVRQSVTGPRPVPPLPRLLPGEGGPVALGRVHGVAGEVPVYDRARLGAGQVLRGPALVTEQVATTWLAPGWTARVDEYGNLLMERA